MFVLAVRLSGRSVLLSPSVDHVAMFIFLNYKEQIRVPTIFRKYKVQPLFMIRRILNIVTLWLIFMQHQSPCSHMQSYKASL